MKIRSYKKSHWMKRKGQHLERIMHEIQKRINRRENSQSIKQACATISNRLANNPLRLGENRLYSPSAFTIRNHYALWKKGPQFAKLYPAYRPGKKKASDEVAPYLLYMLLQTDTNSEAFHNIHEEWKAGHTIPGIGRLREHLQADECKRFPVDLASLAQHRLTSNERDEIQTIRKARREIARRTARLNRSLGNRLDVKSSRYLKGDSNA